VVNEEQAESGRMNPVLGSIHRRTEGLDEHPSSTRIATAAQNDAGTADDFFTVALFYGRRTKKGAD
jgi:hypothetical protein